jgi:hypothetical protein
MWARPRGFVLLAARVGLSEADLATWRLAKVQTVDIDPVGQVIMRVDGCSGDVGRRTVRHIRPSQLWNVGS